MRHKCQIPQMFGTALPSTWDALPPDTSFLICPSLKCQTFKNVLLALFPALSSSSVWDQGM